ncbi:MAG: hypothetical protein UHI81_02970 [Olegusella sp.]|nr:hypothetical protein [Olegusella sp.]
MADEEIHLDVYENKSVLYGSGEAQVFYEGIQSAEAAERYSKITEALENGFMADALQEVRENGFNYDLPDKAREILEVLGDGVTSDYGRALVDVCIMQLAIKAICPEQSVRLHKGSNMSRAFSWRDGISMRSIDQNYIAPFLRESGLLKLNNSGAMMTRTFAENYPYSSLYKANIRGPKEQWVELVNGLEDGSIEPRPYLGYLLAMLQNRSDHFRDLCAEADTAIENATHVNPVSVEKAVKLFLRNTGYAARAFEISLHSFMQALDDLGYSTADLEPLSQMRSANKKHGNVGDIETKDGGDIIESWDAKYKKPYLIDELYELEDKLSNAPRVMTAGFVTDEAPDIRDDVRRKMEDIENEFSTEVRIYSLHEWIEYQVAVNNVADKELLASAWLSALEESLTLKRLEEAPIDEPCDQWVVDLTKVIKHVFK